MKYDADKLRHIANVSLNYKELAEALRSAVDEAERLRAESMDRLGQLLAIGTKAEELQGDLNTAILRVGELTGENAQLRDGIRAAEAERDEARTLHASICMRVARLESQYRDISQAHDKALGIISHRAKVAS